MSMDSVQGYNYQVSSIVSSNPFEYKAHQARTEEVGSIWEGYSTPSCNGTGELRPSYENHEYLAQKLDVTG